MLEHPVSRLPQSGIIYLPDTLDFWPWPRNVNPHYSICKAESSTWCESFGAFDKSAQDAFNKCDFNLLASLAYPFLDKEGCRIGCDLMNLFFVIDEHTDMATPDAVRLQVGIIMDAIRNPHIPRSKDEWIGGEVARQFWANAILRVTPTAQRRFIDAFQTYLDSVVEEVTDRTSNHIRSVESYFEVRRKTIGVEPSLAISEMYMNIPEEVMSHHVIETLTRLCTDLVIIGNDLCSYSRELAHGLEGHNLVTIVMHELDLNAQSAIDWIGDFHEDLVNQFLNEWHNIPTNLFGGSSEVDRDIYSYCQSLANWVRANDAWSFESERYFGIAGRQIQETRQIRLFSELKVRN